MYLELGSASKHKHEPRWHDGVSIEVKDEAGEIIEGTDQGIAKARGLKRKPGIRPLEQGAGARYHWHAVGADAGPHERN